MEKTSFVTEHPVAAPAAAHRHFHEKLAFETDPADVQADIESGRPGFLVVDARAREAFLRAHIPGAVNVPHREMTAERMAPFASDTLFVVYCDGIGCNASTKGALKLSGLGYRVKELMGGIDWWVRDGFPVERGEGAGAQPIVAGPAGAEDSAPARTAIACGCN